MNLEDPVITNHLVHEHAVCFHRVRDALFAAFLALVYLTQSLEQRFSSSPPPLRTGGAATTCKTCGSSPSNSTSDCIIVVVSDTLSGDTIGMNTYCSL
ncbi:hypothetical protein GN244_ATG14025 [Phytophthora infestans]|uniref:Uncharacterized protein n=1 Tax=Phytophthora infestans TaxID=4787 RepID=A0A833SWU9_PHYIN|nr:hypothetical protein GN244_ATG14025 [Phytophthora infestans]KAF4139847.1 hypothetical protein GN958_ATG10955 [Phytophthora infestans]